MTDELVSPVFVAVRSLGHVWLLTTPWTAARQELYSLSLTFPSHLVAPEMLCLSKFKEESFLTRYSFWRALWIRAAHFVNITGVVCPSLSFIISRGLLKLVSSESVMPFNHFVLCRPLLLLPWIFPSIRVFSNESALHIGWPKYWSFSFIISPSNEYSGLIFCRIKWFDLLAVQGTVKNTLQYQSLKASVLQRSAFFMVQLSYPYMTTGKP